MNPQSLTEAKREDEARKMPNDDLIDWLAHYANKGTRDWGYLRREILRRLEKGNPND